MQLTPLCTPDVSVKALSQSGQAIPVRCKRWSCEVCARLNKRKVIAAGLAGRPRAMLTLTVSSKHYDNPTEAAHALKRGLRNLRLDLKRHEKLANFEYLAVFEEHKSGYPHLHLLITGKFIPWQYLRKTWQRITSSTHIHIRKIREGMKDVNYIAKYLTKDLHAFEGCKRWWRSHGYPRPEPEEDADPEMNKGWGRFEINFYDMIWNMKLAGYKIEKDPSGRITWLWPSDEGQPPGWQWSASGGLNSMRRKDFRK